MTGAKKELMKVERRVIREMEGIILCVWECRCLAELATQVRCDGLGRRQGHPPTDLTVRFIRIFFSNVYLYCGKFKIIYETLC